AWSSGAELLLIKCLLKAVSENHQSDNNFKPSVYTSVAKHLTAKEYKIVKTLRSLLGFGWDDSKKMVTAEPQVWDAYLKGHKKAWPFRRKPFPFYDKIGALIGDCMATGKLAF
ncbi:hypothetical protein L208DRAFT_1214442, partial [Tricholoma matsutake]